MSLCGVRKLIFSTKRCLMSTSSQKSLESYVQCKNNLNHNWDVYFITAKYGEGTSVSDSRTCLKESPGTDSATDSHLLLPKPDNANFLSPDTMNYRRGTFLSFNKPLIFINFTSKHKIWIGSRRPSILPVPDMVTSSLNIASENQDDDVEVDESEDELEDDVPWRSPSEKIA